MAATYKDYYQILGVDRNTKQEDIQRAYRKLARKYHPDINKAADAEQRFKEVNEAYQVLKDPEKREKYDRLGENWEQGQDFRPPPGWEGSFDFGRGAAGAGGGFQAGGGDFSDFFESLFGQAFRQQGGRAGRGQPFYGAGAGADQEAVIRLSLEDAFSGGTRSITLTSQEMQADGTVRPRNKTYDVKIPAGILPGQKIRLAGQGAPGRTSAGDLYLKVELEPHPRFELKGRDLYTDVSLSPWEAALGAQVPVSTVNGSVNLKVPAGTQSGQKLRLKSKGMPNPKGSPGNLYAKVQIRVPRKMSPEEKRAFEELQRISSFNPRSQR